MYRLLRFYNQNRHRIWFAIIVIAFVIFIIQVLNNVARIQNEEEVNNTENQETTYNNVVSYDKESEPIISDSSPSVELRNENGQLIDDFFTKCLKHNFNEAYELLSNDIKNNMYQSESLFENLYCKNRFDGDKQYSFQLWMSNNNMYTYLVKVYDNMLTTGKSNDEYIEDYVTAVKEDGKYVLNINSYVGKEGINVSSSNDDLTVRVNNGYIYKDYEIFEIVIKNNTDQAILLDSEENVGTTYVTDNMDNKFEAVLNENIDSDLIINPNEVKTIQIKFNVIRREDMNIKSMVFSDIVTNYDNYINGQEDKNVTSLEIDF